jgi:hypothetical protein
MLADYRIQMGRNLLRPILKLLVSGQPSSETDSRKGLTLSGFASPRGNSGGPMFNAAGEVIGIVSHNISEGGGQRGPEVRHHHEDSPAPPAREELVSGAGSKRSSGYKGRSGDRIRRSSRAGGSEYAEFDIRVVADWYWWGPPCRLMPRRHLAARETTWIRVATRSCPAVRTASRVQVVARSWRDHRHSSDRSGLIYAPCNISLGVRVAAAGGSSDRVGRMAM